MSIKISQLPSTGVLADANVFPLVANVGGTLTSEQATLAVLKNYVLAGNATTATKLVTSRNINGVAFDGTQDITITVPLSPATSSVIGGVKIGSGIAVDINGVISVTSTPVATSSTSGSVIVPATGGMKVDGSGNISGNTIVHAFGFDANFNLIYSKIDDTNITMTTDGVNSSYVTYDVGNSQYAYSIDANGNLIATFSS
jgi:hypothetical protein